VREIKSTSGRESEIKRERACARVNRKREMARVNRERGRAKERQRNKDGVKE
jgi:hypothetical protein